MKEIEKLGDKTIGIDIDGDKKPDFKVEEKLAVYSRLRHSRFQKAFFFGVRT